MTTNNLTPFIKWVGGKRQLLPELKKLMPEKFNTYYEPFIGGGALLFDMAPEKAVINDFNSELTNAYKQVKQHPNKVIANLNELCESDSKEQYYRIRSLDRGKDYANLSDLKRAVRFIYIIKAGFNGLWRVNSKGQCNTPYGYRKKLKVAEDVIKNDSQYLENSDVRILTGSYKDAVKNVQARDFVYFDPPYIPITASANFTSYTKNGFNFEDQEELRDVALKLAKKGAYVMLSNNDVPLIEKLYCDNIFSIHHVKARRNINSNGKKRGEVGEVIITTYKNKS